MTEEHAKSEATFENPLRRKLQADKPAYGLWVTLSDATVTEIAVDAGVDWIVVDMEHGPLECRDLLDHVRASNGSDLAVIARLPANSIDGIKRALDTGAHGVLLPMIRSAEEVRTAFKFARYPPIGQRGLGGERATRWGWALESYVRSADRETLVIPMIETVEASNQITDILSVEGLEAIFFGTADLSQSRGHRAQWEGPGVAEDVARMLRLAQDRGIASGIVSRGSDDVHRRIQQGFRMIALGADTGLIARSLRDLIKIRKEVIAKNGYF
jgi:2-keto-3-deoxy-L-rhamnonate aldolase RhmA